VASDDELRKVAEDMRALARALGRDVRDAVEQAVREGRSARGAVKDSVRAAKADAKRTYYQQRPPGGWGPCGPWGRRGYWGGPPWVPKGQPTDEDPSRPSPGPGGPPTWAGGRPWTPRTGYAGGPPWVGPSWHRPRPARPPAPPVRRRWDATTLIGMLAVVFGLAWLVSAVGAIHLSVEGVVAVGLMLLGAALVVTARTDWSLSRRGWPVWLGLGLIVVLLCTSTTFGIGSTLNSISFGNKTVAAPIAGGTVHGGFGNLTVNVPSSELGTLKVVSVAGNTYINVPQSVSAFTLNARLVGGQMCVNGNDVGNGMGIHYDQLVGSPGATSPAFILDVHQMFGEVFVNGGCHR
jgi:hypothetical protein